MENSGFVRNGILKLPPGFRFHPTDEELVVQYLKKKVFDFPLPASIIPDADVCRSDPWDLPGELEQMKYFFSTKESKYPSGCRSNRATISGYWKSTGIDKEIVTSKNNLVGMKKTLVFYRGKPPRGARTNWVMHEYRLANSPSLPEDNSLKGSDVQFGKWVLCRIFLKKRASKNEEDRFDVEQARKGRNSSPVFYDFLRKQQNDDPACSSSEFSEITEVTCEDRVDDNDENNSCDSFLHYRRTP